MVLADTPRGHRDPPWARRTSFDVCVDSADVHTDVASETEAGRALGVAATPTIMVDGVPFTGSSYEELLTTIQAALDTASRTP